ncbi:MAG: hypothetical protein D6744_03790, partial [Planctomycetota bacterium]
FTRRRAAGTERFSFEPAEEDGRAALDSCVAPRLHRQLKWRLLGRALGVDASQPAGEALDAALDGVYERHLRLDPIDRYVLLAFDRYHDGAGRRPPFPSRRGVRASDIYTSNTLVRAACLRDPRRFLFGASVHPYRDDAPRCVEEVFAGGACLMKWMPLHQNIDMCDERTLAVLEVCAELGLPLLYHFGPEFTLRTNHPEHEPIVNLFEALSILLRRGRMPITIVAHVATPTHALGDRASHDMLLGALRGDFARRPLYADISALAALGKLPFLRRLAERTDLHHKLLFGSDFPVPPALSLLATGAPYEPRPDAATEWPNAAVHAYRAAGFSEIVFHRAAELLPNVEHFRTTPTAHGDP